jgi:asparagine synthase (glutamine-hydrolysing)
MQVAAQFVSAGTFRRSKAGQVLMCGIAGFSGEFDRAELESASRLIAHRGPDSSGILVEPGTNFGLAHTRLAILDLSSLGAQPMESRSGRYVIVFNGEIYNFQELRAPLEASGVTFRGHSDTEVLLALYEQRGSAMLPLLNGIFAFAIIDRQDRALFLAVDRAGVKPLYVHEGTRGLTFASELKALIPLLNETPAIDVECLFRTLGHLWCPGGNTPFKGVARLGPGEAMQVSNGRVKRRWQWTESSFIQRLKPFSEQAAVSSVADTVRQAVHRQLIADVPVGAFLSGGLDSSAIVAFAREKNPAIECFTIDTGPSQDVGVTDDLPYARRVAAHLRVPLHEVRVAAGQLAASLEQMVLQLDEPLADPAPLHVRTISQLARDHGYKVLLSGAGGDDIFSGYRRHRALLAERYWSWLPKTVRTGLRTGSASAAKMIPVLRRVAKAFANADRTPCERLAGYFLWADPQRIRMLFSPEYRSQICSSQISDSLINYASSLPATLDPLSKMLALEQRFFLADHNLLYTDKMSMAAGVEVRVPFLDNDLVALANSLPSSLKQRGSVGKWIFKKAMEPYLPHDVIYRPKTGFGVPLRRWLRGELREWIGDILSANALRRRGIFNPAAVAQLIEDDRTGKVDAAYTILSLATIEIWCRHFLDQRGTYSCKN